MPSGADARGGRLLAGPEQVDRRALRPRTGTAMSQPLHDHTGTQAAAADGGDAPASAPAGDDPAAPHHAEPRRDGALAEGERAPAAAPPGAPRPDAGRPAAADLPRARATASASASPTTQLAPLGGRVRAPASSSSRSATSSCCPSRCTSDLAELRDGQVLWGWPHCVQDAELTQLAIDRRLTLIAFEAMNHWTQRRLVRPARLPQEQRARRLLLGAARPAARRDRPATTAAGCAPSSSASARPPAAR